MKAWLLTLTLSCCSAWVYSQGEFTNWYFGNKTGVRFSGGGPQKVASSSIESGEGVASVSDPAGNLLFYSNGLKVWDSSHQVMKNGDGLGGGLSSSQGVLIIPDPGNQQRYYLFTVGPSGSAGTLSYNIINMNGNGGLGEVEATSKNLFLSSGQTEKLTAARSGSCDYWIISHQSNSNRYEARRITAAGIDLPAYSYVGAIHNEIGMIKLSPDQKKVVATSVTGTVELLDFDAATGQFSNPFSLPVKAGNSTYSACFSPDNSKLYTNEGGYRPSMEFYQFDLSVGDTAGIRQSKALVAGVSTTTSLSLSDLQLGPDGVIYFTRWSATCIGMIPNPNARQPMCGFVENGVCGLGYINLCLPNYTPPRKGLLSFSLGQDTLACPGSNVQLTAPAGFAAQWSTGATTQSISVNTAGSYWVRVDNGQCVGSDTINVNFGGRNVDLGPDTSVCTGTSHRLEVPGYNVIRWSDLSTGPALEVSSAGEYWVEARDRCGILSSDTITISAYTPAISLGADKQLCRGDSVVLTAPPGYAGYSWSPDYRINRLDGEKVVVDPLTDTGYIIKAEEGPGCFAYDTIVIRLVEVTKPSLGADTSVCEGKSLALNAGAGFKAYEWFNGSKLSFLSLDTPAVAWVKTIDINGCKATDSIRMNWKDCGTGLWVPTGFTPNGDQLNDVFRIGWQGKLEIFRIQVYNRLGEVVFSTTDPARSWDGRHKGIPAASQVYAWVCEYKFVNRPAQKQSGTLQLIR